MPVAAGGVVDGAVRITYPTSAVEARITRYWLILLAIAVVVARARGAVGTAIAGFVIRPLRSLERAAAAVGDGDLDARAPENDGPPEVRSLAAVFNRTVARLEQLLRSQNEFVADASHQLRTPLTALRLRLENLEQDLREPSAGTSRVRSRRSSAWRAWSMPCWSWRGPTAGGPGRHGRSLRARDRAGGVHGRRGPTTSACGSSTRGAAAEGYRPRGTGCGR